MFLNVTMPGGKVRLEDRRPVTPAIDPIIGQVACGTARVMDEPAPNDPSGNRRTSLEMPEQFGA